jgi:hypothetical protein
LKYKELGMDIDRILNEINQRIEWYRDAGQYGEVFGLKMAREIVYKESIKYGEEEISLSDT